MANRIKLTITVLPDTYNRLRALADISGRTIGDTIDSLINGCEDICSSRRSIPLKIVLEKYKDALIHRLIEGNIGNICVSESINSIECYFIDYYTRELLSAIGEYLARGRIKPRDLISLRKPVKQ